MEAITSVKKSTILESVLSCVSVLVDGYIPWEVSLTFYDKIFDVLHARFNKEEDDSIASKLLTQMIKYAHDSKQTEVLKNWYDLAFKSEAAKTKLTLPIKWKIVFAIQKCIYIS